MNERKCLNYIQYSLEWREIWIPKCLHVQSISSRICQIKSGRYSKELNIGKITGTWYRYFWKHKRVFLLFVMIPSHIRGIFLMPNNRTAIKHPTSYLFKIASIQIVSKTWGVSWEVSDNQFLNFCHLFQLRICFTNKST